MRDTGLFISMLEDGTQADVLQGNLYAYKGAIFENLMADFLTKAGQKLYYYHKDSGLEIDFVTRHESRCTIVEKKKLIFSSKRSRIVNGASVRIILRQVIMHKGKGKRMAWYEEVVFYHIYPLGLLGAPEYTHCPEYHRSITDQTMED